MQLNRGRLWPIAVYRVSGHSMQPTYQPGDMLLGWRPGAHRLARPGRVVVAHTPAGPSLKRVTVRDSGQLHLRGDNSADSHDSRHYGAVPSAQVEAIVFLKLP